MFSALGLLPILALPLTLSVSTAQVINNIENTTDIKCYQCYGMMGDVTNCGDTLYPEDPINITSCTHSCAKIMIYMIDQRIGIARDCVPDCENGCMKNMTSWCYYCCDSALCNAAGRLLSQTLSMALPLLLAVKTITN